MATVKDYWVMDGRALHNIDRAVILEEFGSKLPSAKALHAWRGQGAVLVLYESTTEGEFLRQSVIRELD